MNKNSILSIIALACLFAFGTTNAKAQDFNVGDIDIQFGLGFAKTYTGSFIDFSGYNSFPAVLLSGEYGIYKENELGGVISIGGIIGYSSISDADIGWDWRSNTLILGGKGVYHLKLIDELDTYAGINIFLVAYSTSKNGILPYNVPNNDIYPRIGLFVGSKYYLTNDLALFGELGYSIAWLTLGASFKF
jgi:hypothetical protein